MSAQDRSIIVRLNIPALEYQRLYQGLAQVVNAKSIQGNRVRFPANILRPFVTHTGIVGTFAIYFSYDNRFQKIEKIDE